ncbi:hypothetical protein [Thalassotalea profundi]|uniref:Chlorhexidine efflux transporter domain-containing protein n=1 Tax=Thalassotalea profundi TaxID=2036687 RepID=A0ABQ3J8U6_9GAMM|nr:hypothetical protein [Thalassotalea profundi]GHF02350.1 hypothetical protein GCM10011501_34710 [Thalassotalea profundi]
MHKEVKPKKRNEFSRYVAIFLSALFTIFMKRTVEDSFTYLQELSFLMDLGLYLIIFVPLHYLISKFTDWLYSDSGESNS